MKKKIIVAIVASLFLGAVGYKSYLAITKAKEKKKKIIYAAPVIFAPITTGSINDLRSFSGTLEAETEFDLMPKIGGLIKKVYVDIGDRVKNGQLVAEIADEELQMALREKQAQLEVAEARLRESNLTLASVQKEYDRAITLRKSKVISVVSLEQQKTDLTKAKIRTSISLSAQKQAQMGLEVAQLHASYAKLHVQWEGADAERIVAERYLDDGARVTSGKPVVRIVGINRLRAVIHVPEKDYTKLKVNQLATLHTDAHPDKTFEARVVRVAPVISRSSRQARVLLDVPNEKHLLRPGMFAKAQLVFKHKADVILIPDSALCAHKGKAGIYRADSTGTHAVFVPVKVGIQTGGQSEIISPKLAGRVIVVGQHLLRPKARIIDSQAGTAGKGAK